jgi:hypothetical protein
MTFPPVTLAPEDLTTCTPAEPGANLGSGGPYCITENDITNSQSRESIDSKARRPERIRGFDDRVKLKNTVLGVLGDTDQAVLMRGKSRLTYGFTNDKFAEIGGAVIDASRAKKVVVTLGEPPVKNTSTETVRSRFIPDDVRSSLKTGKINTVTLLSKGADSYTGSSGRDLAALGRGNDGAVMGKGRDIVALNQRMNRKVVELGKGKDRVLIDDGALKNKGRLTITDFNNRKDTLLLETKASKVDGVGTDTLSISTKGGTLKVITDRGNFSGSSIDYVV